jgi:hypothetical protein
MHGASAPEREGGVKPDLRGFQPPGLRPQNRMMAIIAKLHSQFIQAHGELFRLFRLQT